ncbi:hypothetical protein ACF08N_36930 [Streptomyces sp. NPDC015127]|uniref:hypothetical protein n=1 Tax=Streptomyces sp. NPDC015127 TaxID=3364939 RepID=UPI0036F4DDE5
MLGAEDFTLRKGHNYSTILIYIETHLLPDRTTSTVVRSLGEHPDVDVMCRDRSTADAEAGRLGAPNAIHVAVQWHIWSNLAEVSRRRSSSTELCCVSRTARVAADMGNANLEPSSPADRGQPAGSQTASGTRPSMPSSAEASDCARSSAGSSWPSTSSHAADPDDLLVDRWTGRTSIVDPYKPYLHRRWAEGCTVAADCSRKSASAATSAARAS